MSAEKTQNRITKRSETQTLQIVMQESHSKGNCCTPVSSVKASGFSSNIFAGCLTKWWFSTDILLFGSSVIYKKRTLPNCINLCNLQSSQGWQKAWEIIRRHGTHYVLNSVIWINKVPSIVNHCNAESHIIKHS